jgi:hypothetical protein
MLAIFDMSSINLERYNSELLKNYSHQYIGCIDDSDLCKPISDNCLLVCTGWWTISKFIAHFKQYCVSVIIVSGQRPADLRILLAASELSIPVIYKMHGIYIPFMKRGARFYLTKLGKSFRTLLYLIDIWFFTRNLSISYGMFMSFMFGRPRTSWAGSDKLRINVGLIWSEYWGSWHKKYWAMEPEDGWLIVGNPDTLKFNQVEIDDDGLVYIYQTLVEDGRIDINQMNRFYDNLQIVAKRLKKTVHIKWHPRGGKNILSGLVSRGFKIHSDFPKADLYIGHYSTLLGVAPILGGHVIAVELEGHLIPESIRQISYKVVEDVDELGSAIDDFNQHSLPKKSEAIYYFGGDFDINIEISAVKKLLNDS